MAAQLAINMPSIANEQSFTFKMPCIEPDGVYSEESLRDLRARIDDMNHGRNVSQHELIEVKDD